MILPKPKYEAPSLQEEVRHWWQNNPMAYDWRNTNTYAEGTREWFEEIDRRFFSEIASFFAQEKGAKSFSRLIPFTQLKDKDVLEIGCGTGAHARLIAEAGARLTAIDLTEKAVSLTQRRLAAYGLRGNINQMDAESMSFLDRSFDFVWSWGVIHHSARTERVVAEIARVLRPGGQARLMVYHSHSVNLLAGLIRGCLTGRLFRQGAQETLNYYSDGRVARYYTSREFASLFQDAFHKIDVRIFGQKNELVPIPGWGPLGKLKISVTRAIPDSWAESLLAHMGTFLFLTAEKK